MKDGAVLGRGYYDKHTTSLRVVKDRYMYGGRKLPNHHGDCEIYRAIDVYGFAPCTCGFIHDLYLMPNEMATRVYPKYLEDRKRELEIWSPNPLGSPRYVPPEVIPVPLTLVDQIWSTLAGKRITVSIDIMAVWKTIAGIFGSETTCLMEVEYSKAFPEGGPTDRHWVMRPLERKE